MNWREEILNWPVSWLVILLSVSIALIPRWTDAAPIPSGAVSAPAAAPEELQRVLRALEQKTVAHRLAQLGLSAREVTQKIEALGDDELHALASRAAEVEAGGDGAGAIAMVIIFALLIILLLELLGRRVISRP